MNKDKLVEFEKATSILPLLVSDTGHLYEPLINVIVCSSIGGRTDSLSKLPKHLTLISKLADGKEYTADYLISKVDEKRLGRENKK